MPQLNLNMNVSKRKFKSGDLIVQCDEYEIFVGILCAYQELIGFILYNKSFGWQQAQRRLIPNNAISLKHLIAQTDLDHICITKAKLNDLILIKSRTITLGVIGGNSTTIIKVNAKGDWGHQLFNKNTQYIKVEDILQDVL